MTLRSRLTKVLSPLARLLRGRAPARDPWERYDYHVPPTAFGSGNRHDIAWYFEGDSTVRVSSLDEIQDWLLGCEYVDDTALFNETDFWQHPRTFEQLRRGDCEDHALWAWRKLIELGADADLVTGSVLQSSEATVERGGHAWILVREREETFVFETVAKSKARMLRPLVEVRDHYRPEYGVDRERRYYAFYGALVAFNEAKDRGTRRTHNTEAG